MPTSWYQAVPTIIDLVQMDGPQSILDIGVGFGKYGVLLREVFDIPYERYDKKNWHLQLDGVEGFEGYNNPIHDYVYNKMYYGNIFSVLPKLSQKYDTLLLIDVLEHFEKEEGLRLIAGLLEVTNRSLIVSTPIWPAPQGDYIGNELETHKSRWNIVDFVDFDFQFNQVKVGNNGANLFKFYPSNRKKSSIEKDKSMKIGYIVPHQNLTGGLKMLLTQMEMLKERGHHVTAYYRGMEGQRALPSWSDVVVDREVIIPPLAPFKQYVEECDVVVAGWFPQLLELKDINTPVFYYEQGHELLFGDVPEYNNFTNIKLYLQSCYKSGIPIATISSFVSRSLMARFDISSEVIPIGIDVDVYKPIEKKEDKELLTVLLVGNPHLRFKSFNDAIRALQIAWDRGLRFHVKWVCQSPPSVQATFPIETIVHPRQEVLIQYYQEADIFLFTSWYEGYGMPPLEAMSCGTPVITSDCGGVRDYAVSEYNCLLADPGDTEQFANHLERLLKDGELRKALSEKGRETALSLKYENSVSKIEEYMRKLI
ncbi:glycosyltransferase family 4 protein [Psychrobacillus sp. L4]|uniref:glycosyltransferase family 4 protein n=1 Tax=Psychrobacillus sp. L4 TaxID=3236892 RepID=UPI0036F26324